MIQRDFDFSTQDNSIKLSVVLMADSFFYGIFDIHDTLVCHQSYTNVMFSEITKTNEIASDNRLQRKFHKVSVVVMSGDNHQIDFKDDALLKLFPGLELKNIKVERLPGQSMYNYFGISPHQERLILNLWSDHSITYKSLASLLTAYYLGTFSPTLHLHIEEGTLFVFAQKEGKLYLYNSFVTKSKTDILYFTLAACQALGVHPTSDKVTVSGWVDKDSALIKELQGYIGDLQILADADHRCSSELPSQFKPHFYFIHHANIQCVS